MTQAWLCAVLIIADCIDDSILLLYQCMIQCYEIIQFPTVPSASSSGSSLPLTPLTCFRSNSLHTLSRVLKVDRSRPSSDKMIMSSTDPLTRRRTNCSAATQTSFPSTSEVTQRGGSAMSKERIATVQERSVDVA